MIGRFAGAGAIALAVILGAAALSPAGAQDAGASQADKRQQRSERLLKRFDRLDRNRDGVLERSEVERPSARLFKRADRNNDGVVDREEIKRLEEARSRKGGEKAGRGRGGQRLEKRFERADKNRDGQVTREEFVGGTSRWFSRADVDRDGRVTKAEVEKFAERRPSKRRKRNRDVE